MGKGITASSIGRLLKSRGINVTSIKIDPYLNIDAGTMNPFEHGEVYVLDDGGEVDLDLGNYERFMDLHLGMDNNITTGKVYRTVIENERRGEYLGKTVQIIPHITNEIKRRITAVARQSGADVAIVELGGTVGDIESMPFLEAARQLGRDLGREENVMFIHTTLIPIMGSVGEEKSKPTQHSVRDLMSVGIKPDIIVGRCSRELSESAKAKIAMFCDVDPDAVIQNLTAKSIYEVPQLMEEQGLADTVDPLGGSYYVEALTDKIEAEAWEYIKKIDEIGGAPEAIAKGYIQKEIQDSAYKWQMEIEKGDRIIVGVNKFTQEEEAPKNLLRVDGSVGKLQAEKIAALKARRDNAAVEAALKALEAGCADENVNLMPLILDAVRAYATEGEICGVMRKVFGEYQPHTTL